MFNSDVSQILQMTTDGRYSEMDMDLMLNYENAELMSSDFFDTIRSVESGIQDDLLSSSADELNALSDTSSHIDGCISPRNDVSESERSSVFTDESDSPLRSLDAIDDSLFDFLQPLSNSSDVEMVEVLENLPVVVTPPKTTKIIIQNPVNKKIINKPVIANSQIKKFGKKQILKVQPLSNNGKPVILPYGLNNIKILKTSHIVGDKIHVTTVPANRVATKRKIEGNGIRVGSHSNKGPMGEHRVEVKLTSEERRLLEKEGIKLPAYHPLTKMEDRELKRIRRKIRNKISAQDSRKRKKEYVDGLEERVRRGSEDNRNLMQRVKELQKKNKTLMAHINKLQSLLFNSSSKATPSTCLMIVMLSVLLVSLPNLRLNQQISSELSEQEQVTTSRSLLSTKKDDGLNMEEFFIFNKDEESADNENNTDEFFKTIEDLDGKYDYTYFEKENSDDNMLNTFFKNLKNLFNKSEVGTYSDSGGFYNKKGFIEPDIDEYDADAYSRESPAKKMKLVDSPYHQNDENFVPLANKIISATVTETKDK